MGCGGPTELGGDVQIKTTMTTPTPITEPVLAALIYVRNNYEEGGQWDLACDKMHSEIVNKDRGRGAPQLAAAARILADEVERLRKELNTNTQPL